MVLSLANTREDLRQNLVGVAVGVGVGVGVLVLGGLLDRLVGWARKSGHLLRSSLDWGWGCFLSAGVSRNSLSSPENLPVEGCCLPGFSSWDLLFILKK